MPKKHWFVTRTECKHHWAVLVASVLPWISWFSVQFSLNLDGVPIFGSTKFALWPFWLECNNLPPKLQCKFVKIILLSLWHGLTKPDLSDFLAKTRLELECLSQWMKSDKSVEYRCRFIFLICDMPAKAVGLEMNQFSGFNGCTHCPLIGIRVASRLLYPCDAQYRLGTPVTFEKHAQKWEKWNEIVAGIKGVSPLASAFTFPYGAPVNAMPQIFLGTGKTLPFAKCLYPVWSKVKHKKINKLLKECLRPTEFLRKPKNVSEMSFWKASDFKVLFLHIIPLIIDFFRDNPRWEKR